MIYRNIISRNIDGDVYLKKGKLFKLKKPYSDYWLTDTLDEISDQEFMGVLKENNLIKTQAPSCPILNSNRLDKIHLQLNNNCMCRCTHCYVGDYKKSELNMNDIKGIFAQAMACGVHTIEYSGGEPTLNNSFIEIIKYGKSLGLEQMLFTNGFFPVSHIEPISTYVDIVQISIDGPREYHNAFRKNNLVFDKAISAIQAFAKKQIKMIISMSVVPENIEYIPFVYGLAKENGASFRISPPAPVGRFCENNTQTFYLNYLNKSKEICKRNNIELKEFKHRAPACSALTKTVYINCFKQVFPCPLLSDDKYCIGNLNENTLQTLIDNKQSLEILSFIDTTKQRVKDSCFFCPAFMQETEQDITFFGELI